MRQVLFIPT